MKAIEIEDEFHLIELSEEYDFIPGKSVVPGDYLLVPENNESSDLMNIVPKDYFEKTIQSS